MVLGIETILLSFKVIFIELREVNYVFQNMDFSAKIM